MKHPYCWYSNMCIFQFKWSAWMLFSIFKYFRIIAKCSTERCLHQLTQLCK